ncbi:MAG: tetratricopeptide repeat protein [Anaerolineales bacterium]|nr:tetratricopeptide repeat protein [Anaerolineales bacterium]
MAQLKLFLLGGAGLKLDGEPLVGLASRKAEALLIYLACQPQPQPRDLLATLLWDDRPQQRALGNLSVLLSSLRKPLGELLLSSRQTVGLDEAGVWADALVLARAVGAVAHKPLTGETAVSLQTTLALYHGDFLTGFAIRDASAFEEWQLLEQERLHRLATAGWEQLTTYYLEKQQWAVGIAAAQQLLRLDPLRERAQRQLMQLLAGDGQRHAALAQFDQCRQLLADELGVEPEAETVALAARIRAGEQGSRGAGETISPLLSRLPAPLHNLPSATTPLVGREIELAAIATRLAEPNCRLLTLLGPGGVGKTRLALAAAEAVAKTSTAVFPHGIWFVSLAELDSGALLPTTIADAVNLSLAGTASHQAQLLGYLRQKQLLLVLDNAEHLLAETAVIRLLQQLLTHTPGLKLLVTSRERLDLRGEWLLPVEGLPIPTVAPGEETYAAATLFVQCAQRVRPEFQLTAANREAVWRICQLVEGVPLGIELAATWLRLLTCAEIGAEIGRSYDFLSDAPRAVAERHQSLQAVFAYSWKLLTANEQQMLARLAVFRGGFSREAAQAVVQADLPTQATLPLLASLVDKSFLRVRQPGRYEMHAMLRQYAAEKLSPAEQERVQDRHAAFYATLLQRWLRPLQGGDQLAALDGIRLELENVRAGWRWALERPLQVAALPNWQSLVQDMSDTMFYFFTMRSWFEEGAQLLGQVVAWLEQWREETAVLRWRIQARHGWLQFLCGQTVQGEETLCHSLTQLAGEEAETIFCHNYLGAAAFYRQDEAGALGHLQQALVLAQRLGDPLGEAIALDIMGRVQMYRQDFDAAESLLQASLARKRPLGDRFGMGFSLQNLGAVAQALGQPERARRLYEESLALREEMGDRRGMGLCLEKLGDLALAAGDGAAARRLYERCEALFSEIGNVEAATAVRTKIAV